MHVEKYTLFLDESSDKDKGILLVAGFAIPNSQLDIFSNSILDVKRIIWEEDYIKDNTTILHCTELKTIYSNRRNPDLYRYINRPEYKLFKKMDHTHIKDIYDKIYIKLCEIIKTFDSSVDLFWILKRPIRNRQVFYKQRVINQIHFAEFLLCILQFLCQTELFDLILIHSFSQMFHKYQTEYTFFH